MTLRNASSGPVIRIWGKATPVCEPSGLPASFAATCAANTRERFAASWKFACTLSSTLPRTDLSNCCHCRTGFALVICSSASSSTSRNRAHKSKSTCAINSVTPSLSASCHCADSCWHWSSSATARVPCGVGVEGCDGWDVVPIE